MKGHITEALMILMLVAIGLMFGILIVANFTDVFNEEFDEGSCAASIQTHSAVVRITREEATPQIDCPTEFVKEEVKENEEAQEIIARQMARCWAVWGKGQIPLFGEEEGTYCHVCSMITIEGINEVNGLPYYLDTAEYMNDRTYSQYIAGQKTGTYFAETKAQDKASDTFRTDKPIAVVFHYAKGRSWVENLWLFAFKNPIATGAVAGVGLGVATAATGGGALAVVTAGSAGGAAGGAAAVLARPETSTISMVYARPMTAGELQKLGCQILATSE